MISRRDLARALARLLLTTSLLAVVTTTSVNSYSFWSASSLLGKVMKPPTATVAQQSETTRGHQQAAAGGRHKFTSATTTSSSTTEMSPPPPLELHFEINPEGLAYERVPDAGSGDGSGEELPTAANGSLILEDLVNQFARNFQAGGALNSRASNKSRAPAGSREFAAEPTTAQTMSMQLLDLDRDDDRDEQSQRANEDDGRGASFAESHDSLVGPPAEEPDPDRHIQYDTSNLLTNNAAGDSAGTHQALHIQDAQNLSQSTTTSGELKSNQTGRAQPPPPPPTLTVSQILTNVTNPTRAHHSERRTVASLENDTSISGPAMASNGSRAPAAAANLIQARSMSPGSSGHLSSLSNHRPPVVGQKPPYASSYQLHHRNGAIDLSNSVSRDGLNASSHGANQVAPPVNKRHDQTTTTNGGELTSSINSISSSLLTSDSLGPVAATSTTTSTTTAKPPQAPLPGLAQTLQSYLAATAGAGFSERQDERAEELERVANKLAPSELTELNPIESPSVLNGAPHKLHYQPDQVFPADTGPSPADSGQVVGAHYHADHYAPQLTSSGLSEPANSISSYLQAQQAASIDRANDELNQRAHDTRGGAPAAGLATSGGGGANDDERDDRVNSPQVQVHRRTIETLSNQIAHADGNLISANTLAVHQHKERSPPAHNGRDAPSSSQQQQQQSGGLSYAASLINVTAPMVMPLSATEAMEAALGGDPAARQQMHHVGGGTTLMQAAADHQQDQRYATTSQTSAAGAPVQTTPPHRSSYYVIPPPPSDGGPHHLSIYSRPANQFRPGASTTSPTYASDTQSAYEHLVQSASQTQTQTMSAAERERMRTGDSYPQQHQPPGGQHASGFRSPFGQQYPASVTPAHMLSPAASVGVPTPSSYLSGMSAPSPSASSTASPQGGGNKFASSTPPSTGAPTGATVASAAGASVNRFAPGKQQTTMANSSLAATTNGFITGGITNSSASVGTSLAGIVSTNSDVASSSSVAAGAGSQQSGAVGQVSQSASQQQQATGGAAATGLGKRVFNLTRVEHISAECSNDLIRTIIIFNGTFKGIIYSSGYVRDSNCLYVNGTGKTRYDFSIKLNQCGTLGRQEIHPAVGGPGGDGGLRRRDQVMWNTLSIQYNPIIEQEWDEHFRVSCEYGSDFWKTISFSPFNVETNTGAPVVFTVDPPQCQMEILKGHGMVGPRQETITGPVTVGDPLTLLIHMKSEKAGYDILVKNCVAHNGGQQKMQLIDTNGCVVNERFISPFRGTYNDNDLKHVTLYSYLKAFRFTGSPVLYLECEVHMCQSACPPQMCYWRRLSKRSTSGQYLSSNSTTGLDPSLEEFDVSYGHSTDREDNQDDDTTSERSHYVKTVRFNATTSATESPPEPAGRRQSERRGRELRRQEGGQDRKRVATGNKQQENPSDRISLFQALEVRQERADPNSADSGPSASQRLSPSGSDHLYEITGVSSGGEATGQLMCYQRIEIFAFLFTVASILLAAVSVTIGCYYRASSLRRVSLAATSAAHDHRRQQVCALGRKQRLSFGQPSRRNLSGSLSLSSANLCYSPFSPSSASSSSSSCSPTSSESSNIAGPPPGNSTAGGLGGGGCRPSYLLLDQNLHFGPAAAANRANNCLESNNIDLNEIGAHFRFQQLARAATKRQPGR